LPSTVVNTACEQSAAIGSTLAGASTWRVTGVPAGPAVGLGKTKGLGDGSGLGVGSGLGLAATSGLARGCAVAPGDDVATAAGLEQALKQARPATAAMSLSLLESNPFMGS
jgi:hypothetical protein